MEISMPRYLQPDLAGIPRRAIFAAVLLLMLLCTSVDAFAHNVAEGDKGYIQEMSGVQILAYIYLGAKHMVTGYDHLLFLFGVIFFLYRIKDIGFYVTLFAIGHSTTLLFGVLTGISANAYVIDAIIGLSVVYKARQSGRLPALVRLPAQHQTGDFGVRLLPRLRPGDQDPRIRNSARRADR
jgi:hypothetical protein